MLIITPRHTREDLELWKEYEELDAIRSKHIERKEAFALNVINEFVKYENAYVGVSWGKDSVVVADLCLRNKIDIPLVHLYCIPSHNKNCDLVRNIFLDLYSQADYREYICDYSDIYTKNLPNHIQDKETDKIWYATFKEVGKDIIDRHISGVRGKESQVRRIRMSRWGTSTERTCAPIGYWSTEDVFAYLYKYNLPVHPNYGMLGGGRWDREYIRTAEIGDIHGNGIGRTEWEQEYYSDILAKIRVLR